MFKTLAKLIVEVLESQNVKFVFGIPGAGTLELFDALIESKIKNILVTHEQSASFMADAYSRLTGEVGVCCTIGGPGITNMFTGLSEALLDSSSVVVLVSSTSEDANKSFHIHEINQLKALEPIVKKVLRVQEKKTLSKVVSEAFYLAKSAEPGPVVVEIPKNISRETAIFSGHSNEIYQDETGIDEKIKEIANMLMTSKFCCIYAGRGAFEASEELIKLAQRFSAPILTTVSGRGIIPEDHELAVGFGFGQEGFNLSKEILRKADTVLAVGCKFSEFATLHWSIKMTGNLIHIDKNKNVLNKNYPAKIALVCDAKRSLRKILTVIKDFERNKNRNLIKKIRTTKEKYLKYAESIKSNQGVSPVRLYYELRKLLDRNSILITDCGNHQLWAISSFPIFEKRTFISPSDFQAMGFCIPAGIAAGIAYPKRKVICACGDGGFLMTGFELLTAVREKLNLTVIIFNDNAFGLIKEMQKVVYCKTAAVDFINPNYRALSDSFGIRYAEINQNEEIEDALKYALQQDRATIVNCKIKYESLPEYVKIFLRSGFQTSAFNQKLKSISKFVLRHFSSLTI